MSRPSLGDRELERAAVDRRRASETGPTRERRTGAVRWARRSVEVALDRLFQPGAWAARLAYGLRLQGSGGVRLQSYLIPLKRRRPDVPPLRIAFASDFHAGSTTDKRLIEQACQRLVEAKPDVLLLGGDFVTMRAEPIEWLAPLLGAIAAPLGTFAVLGNHDIRANRQILSSAMERAGIDLITNRGVRLPAPHDDITICGLDDPIWGAPDADAAVAGADGLRVVLMHAPDGLLWLEEQHFDLALCGHTHGGQVRLPWGNPIVVPAGVLSRAHHAGFFRLGDHGERALLVSHGVGCSAIPIRLFAHPEVHVLTVG